LQTNSAVVRFSGAKALRIVDVPGHLRIRDQFREYISDAKAVGFVVDSSTISRNGASVAESVALFLVIYVHSSILEPNLGTCITFYTH
jgi:signal recognition particle receptor subunit beta